MTDVLMWRRVRIGTRCLQVLIYFEVLVGRTGDGKDSVTSENTDGVKQRSGTFNERVLSSF